MRKYLLILSILLSCSFVHAEEYGNYDPQRMLTITETPEGKKYSFDVAYLDQMLNDLAAHARNYPPKFDTFQDRKRAAQDVKALSGMLDIVLDGPAPTPEMQVRAGLLNSIAYNLDIPGSAEKTDAIFKKLLAAVPDDPHGNYEYGTFLSGAGKPEEALPYLEKALAAGLADAGYAIGMTYLSLGDKEKALENLEIYKRDKPGDANIDKLIDAIRSGRIKLKSDSN